MNKVLNWVITVVILLGLIYIGYVVLSNDTKPVIDDPYVESKPPVTDDVQITPCQTEAECKG